MHIDACQELIQLFHQSVLLECTVGLDEMSPVAIVAYRHCHRAGPMRVGNFDRRPALFPFRCTFHIQRIHLDGGTWSIENDIWFIERWTRWIVCACHMSQLLLLWSRNKAYQED